VLLDVVTLPCGHSLDQRCLQKIVAATSGGRGQRACPVCRHALPAELPAVNVQMCTTVQRLYPEQEGRTTYALVTRVTQVKHRRAEVSKEVARKEVAREALETAFTSEDEDELRRSAEAG
jgi:mannose-1-phosphate guanylyltransferase